jgi:hypothetical protein
MQQSPVILITFAHDARRSEKDERRSEKDERRSKD